ncbi:MAG: phosphate acyltransferase PlsX [Holosporales bacterium]|jgi:glycerol-3-phosphate acyltransferase PlsX|nr:phosphate acyltransferase PlsX [Holosporales bacterium]
MKRIALDVMGGDYGIDAAIPGLNHFVSSNDCSEIAFDLFGDEKKITKRLNEFPKLRGRSCIHKIHNTGEKVILGGEKPTNAIRQGRGTSLFEAVSIVSKGEADAVVSSGNTGAYMALAKFLIGTVESIDRPALISVLPNINGNTVMLDLGANTDCNSTKLIQFALMGQAVAKILLKMHAPKVGLLNIGTEPSKGTKPLEEAYKFLKESKNMNFIGFVEGTDITNGTVDIVVTDGFSGNVSLKTMEGTAKYISHFLNEGFRSSIKTKIGYLLCRDVFKSLKSSINPQTHNGAPFVGLKKVVIKSHGASNYIGFSHAISVAIDFAKSEFIKNIEDSLLEMKARASL